RMRSFEPDVVLAHSLGSLISYNAFTHADARKGAAAKALKGTHYVTFGSQIGNPFVLGNLTHGRLHKLDVKHWHHLHNEHDDVFTAPLSVSGVSNFHQLRTPFDLPGPGDHSTLCYLTHNVTRGAFWTPLVEGARSGRARRFGGGDPWARARPDADRGKRRRALLIGIDDYPEEADQLFGCVNDVFSMSATLQDCGFDPQDIRTCLNGRATADGILSRFEWLVDDARPADELVLYYSGHGARVPEYGARQEPGRLTETLVPHDFDWSPERSVSDEQIFQFYAQLPYETQFLMIFDCCHSGSMHRQSAARARGVSPPDDIRHRELKWDRKEEMWVERNFEEINRRFSRRKADRKDFFGENLSTVRIGRAAPLRLAKEKSYKRAKNANSGPVGPFLPLIVEACAEDQLSYEYRHGATSYGASRSA
ncbi:MAG: caspase family protein, partial [Pseudomonadota bacterium]